MGSMIEPRTILGNIERWYVRELNIVYNIKKKINNEDVTKYEEMGGARFYKWSLQIKCMQNKRSWIYSEWKCETITSGVGSWRDYAEGRWASITSKGTETPIVISKKQNKINILRIYYSFN